MSKVIDLTIDLSGSWLEGFPIDTKQAWLSEEAPAKLSEIKSKFRIFHVYMLFDSSLPDYCSHSISTMNPNEGVRYVYEYEMEKALIGPEYPCNTAAKINKEQRRVSSTQIVCKMHCGRLY